ncbi:hypothetical protein [Luteibacter aegosomatissinici]|uniref:hypothetical protein n=1 Tax=Luteibacter aegosomatissinici TaxID=2911539 RepID=UPI001FF8D7C9|nr:hypothetical protein [Luteibacter aegosomatissinici]UPG95540.1 hypothetical protein L2Y97_05375 [Luteibacter aegosomatissinici]
MSTRKLLIAAAILCGASGSLHAADFPVNYAVSDARLDTIRGGFDYGDNLRASFALERTVLVNGVEAIRTSINIPNVAQMSVDQANALADALRTTVVSINPVTTASDSAANSAAASQAAITVPVSASASNTSQAASSSQVVGLPSTVATAVLPGNSAAPGLVIQNSLDNQAITATTTIDASVNTAHMLQNIRVDEAIKDAVIQFRGN